MAETIVSPGVLSIENDQSFVTQTPAQYGAAIIGPTVRGKVGIPTLVTTWSDFQNKYGETFVSGGNTYTYLTSISAYNYFAGGGTSLLVTRVVSGSTATDWTPASSSLIPTGMAATSASVTLNLTDLSTLANTVGSSSFDVNDITFYFTGSTVANTSNVIYLNTTSFTNTTVASYVATSSVVFNLSSSVAPYSASLLNISSSYNSPNITFTYVGTSGLVGNNQFITSGSTTTYFSGGTNTESFVLETLAEGIIMNSAGPTGSNNTLLSGSANNYRWQITNPNINEGTFTLVLRQGNDSSVQQSILETWGPLSLDPFSPNYIERIIGNQTETVANDPTTGEYYIQLTGSFANQSSYIRVRSVKYTTPNYLDNNGLPKPQFTGSIPVTQSGEFGSGKGSNIPTFAPGAYYENISNTNIQGLKAHNYVESISLLANQDAYNYNFILAPGLIGNPTYSEHYPVVQQLVNIVQNRTDAMAVIDVVGFNSNIIPVITAASPWDTSYAATYWPWLKTIDPSSGNQVWCTPSTMIPRVYAQNDNIAYPWFAPAGINRGVLSTVIQTERVLTQGNRDTLYQANVNPIATFPNVGVTVFGQKTLQKKKSALDRVNVRRLLIELKNYISQVADTFVFEQNNQNTRDELSAIINPYLSVVQQQQGLTSFQVIINETNNPPSVVDNNQMVGQIYLQPTRTAEFIILDFNVLPTGATFPA
jgi:hypothetical protein